MKRIWLVVSISSLAAIATVVACSSSSGDATNPGGSDASTTDANSRIDGGGTSDSGATTTIAAARAANVTSPITVVAVVTGLHGAPGDYSQWYIEDAAGGPGSGIAVYCDPDLKSCPTIRAPALHDLVQITGSISTYKGALQFVPTAQSTIQSGATPPPVATVTVTDLLASGDSPYRGVLVKFGSKLTVDNLTPRALYDTTCASAVDAGPDAGLSLCSGCKPPTYSGFEVNDGAGHEIYVENFFFYTEHLQGSPECSATAGSIAVTDGMTFSSVMGILDFDPYSSAQAISPTADSDYVTP